MNLVWMFRDYRDLYQRDLQREVLIDRLNEKIIALDEDNTKLADTVRKLQEYIAANPPNRLDLFEQYQKQILQDEPYVDGKIPDSAWLTPGEMEPVKTDV
jgi:hypothetical protein